MLFNKKITLIAFAFLIWSNVSGQILTNGTLTGSFESNNIYYQTDSTINAIAPDDKIGSNTYFKFDYKIGKFSTGIQYEAYLPPQIGYSQFLEGNKITSRYATYTDSILTFTVGNFYEQFGSGLVFRSYEERSLGINNSIDGALLKFQPIKAARIKALWGKQRKYLENGVSTVRGVDAEFDIPMIINSQSNWVFLIGGSWLGKYQQYTGPNPNIPSTVNALAGRIQIEKSFYSFYSEYVSKGVDPQFSNLYSLDKGNALLVQQSITLKGFGANLSFRKLTNIDSRSERDEVGSVSTLNYVPALSKQHKYTLANIHPYSAQMQGEIGGQLDLFYSVPRNTKLIWAKGIKLNFNVSRYNLLGSDETNILSFSDTLLFSDYSFEFEKKFSSGFKVNLSYINQYYNKGEIEGGDITIQSQIAVVEASIKLKNNTWLKLELSELFPSENENNWSYLMSELSIAPQWTFYASDMIEHAESIIHYYNVGLSFTHDATRFSANWGRNREGLQCAGGLCRYVPAYSGFGMTITTTF